MSSLRNALVKRCLERRDKKALLKITRIPNKHPEQDVHLEHHYKACLELSPADRLSLLQEVVQVAAYNDAACCTYEFLKFISITESTDKLQHQHAELAIHILSHFPFANKLLFEEQATEPVLKVEQATYSFIPDDEVCLEFSTNLPEAATSSITIENEQINILFTHSAEICHTQLTTVEENYPDVSPVSSVEEEVAVTELSHAIHLEDDTSVEKTVECVLSRLEASVVQQDVERVSSIENASVRQEKSAGRQTPTSCLTRGRFSPLDKDLSAEEDSWDTNTIQCPRNENQSRLGVRQYKIKSRIGARRVIFHIFYLASLIALVVLWSICANISQCARGYDPP